MRPDGTWLAFAWLARLAAWWLLLGAGALAILAIGKLLLGQFQTGDAKEATMAAGLLAIGWGIELRAGVLIRRQAAARREARGFEVVKPADAPNRP